MHVFLFFSFVSCFFWFAQKNRRKCLHVRRKYGFLENMMFREILIFSMKASRNLRNCSHVRYDCTDRRFSISFDTAAFFVHEGDEFVLDTWQVDPSMDFGNSREGHKNE